MAMNNHNDELPKLEEIIALMPGNAYWKNRKGVYLGCNNNMAKILQLKSHHDIVGKVLGDLAPQKIADEIVAIDDAIMENGFETCIEEEAFDWEGNPATYFTRKVPLKNHNGKVIGLVGISIDITERKRYEEALKIAKENAESANKTKSDFIMNMSHDIRTPFSGILGLSQFLSKKESDPEKKEILDCIVESSENLLDILNEVIYLATFDQKTITPLKQFNLKALIENIYKIMLPETKRKALEFKVRIKTDMPIYVEGDEYGIKRILLNLVGNAIKFTDAGRVCIAAEAIETTDHQATVKFTVSDSGIGIPDDKFETIFEQFSKLAPSHEGKYQGTGLGLWFVKQLAERMNGEIYVDSKLGEGSQFTCILPLKRSSEVSP